MMMKKALRLARLHQRRGQGKAKFVRQFLDLSTSHLPEEVAAEIHGYLGVVVTASGEYGWLVWVPPAEAGEEYFEEWPRAFHDIFGLARRLGCEYVLIDRDGPEHPDLPTYDW